MKLKKNMQGCDKHRECVWKVARVSGRRIRYTCQVHGRMDPWQRMTESEIRAYVVPRLFVNKLKEHVAPLIQGTVQTFVDQAMPVMLDLKDVLANAGQQAIAQASGSVTRIAEEAGVQVVSHDGFPKEKVVDVVWEPDAADVGLVLDQAAVDVLFGKEGEPGSIEDHFDVLPDRDDHTDTVITEDFEPEATNDQAAAVLLLVKAWAGRPDKRDEIRESVLRRGAFSREDLVAAIQSLAPAAKVLSKYTKAELFEILTDIWTGA